MNLNAINDLVQCWALSILLLVCFVNVTTAYEYPSPRSERFLDLNGLFGRYPNTRPYYGSSGSGFYPSYPNSGYPNSGYPNSGYPNSGYPNSGYPNSGYPNVGYPNSGFPNTGYPNVGYPNVGYPNSGYPSGGYPGYGTGTNMLGGNGGYGGFGGNGGTPTYLGYKSDNYYGNRNVGFGYQQDTSTDGLPTTSDTTNGSPGHRGYK